jgi:hypothetical protein
MSGHCFQLLFPVSSHTSCVEELYSRVRYVRMALDLKQQACRKLVAPEELILNECGLMLFVSTAVMLVSEWGIAWMTVWRHSEVNFVV